MSEFKSWGSFRDFARRLGSERRFIRTSEDEEFLREVIRTSQKRIKEIKTGTYLWRAQLGHSWKNVTEDGVDLGETPAAFFPERMKPVAGRAKEGRANSKGIPVLYLSTRAETAMSEVRPWIGSVVSCAQLQVVRTLRIVDLSLFHKKRFMLYFEEPDAKKKEEAVWSHIDQAFSDPVTSEDDLAEYAPTQLLAELFKSEGHDGIAYKSSFGESGYNIALFNLADAKVKSCALHRVTRAQFSFEQNDNPYWVEDDGSIKTIHVEVVGPAKKKS